MTHFDGIDVAIKWVKEFDETTWQTREPLWSDGLLEQDNLIQHLKGIDVLSDYYWATSLCGRTTIEGPCMNLTVQVIRIRNSDQATIFTIPCDVLRFPRFDVDMIKEQPVWNDLREAASHVDLKTQRLLFFAVVNYDLNHWCGVAVDFNSYDVKVYDPQQNGQIFKLLKKSVAVTVAAARVIKTIPIHPK
ncbi:unnamed protein product [Phytophthora fragariaefolia]|uniref:Unnamed protein product n=1 Tax=Phytophthora fragariaefolia TaxID=1490495 RepID=A0A9W6Y543_9STRA|nr:unnamed protein product [Phytophthora fragariaefolia]